MHYLRNNKKYNKLGITVSSKLGGAVIRNRIRRLVQEAYRLNEINISFGYNIVIVARNFALNNKFQKISQDLVYMLKKAGLYVKKNVDR